MTRRQKRCPMRFDYRSFRSTFTERIIWTNTSHVNQYCRTMSSLVAVCVPVCQNGGTCSGNGICTCTSQWTGSRCSTRTTASPLDHHPDPSSLLAICSPTCSNSGTCINPNVCNCTAQWTGAVCTTRESSMDRLLKRMT